MVKLTYLVAAFQELITDYYITASMQISLNLRVQ